jgi:hypothetical protein
MSLSARIADVRKDYNYQMQDTATVEEIAVALPEAEKLATNDPKLSALQALRQIIQENRASGVNCDVAKDSPELRKAQKLAQEATVLQARAAAANAAINAKRERYWQLIDTVIPRLESSLERAELYIHNTVVLEDELTEFAYRAVNSEHTGERVFHDSLIPRSVDFLAAKIRSKALTAAKVRIEAELIAARNELVEVKKALGVRN